MRCAPALQDGGWKCVLFLFKGVGEIGFRERVNVRGRVRVKVRVRSSGWDIGRGKGYRFRVVRSLATRSAEKRLAF